MLLKCETHVNCRLCATDTVNTPFTWRTRDDEGELCLRGVKLRPALHIRHRVGQRRGPHGGPARGSRYHIHTAMARPCTSDPIAKHPGVQEIERLHLATGAPHADHQDGRHRLKSRTLPRRGPRSSLPIPISAHRPELYLVDVTAPDATPKRLTHTITEEFLSTEFNTPRDRPDPLITYGATDLYACVSPRQREVPRQASHRHLLPRRGIPPVRQLRVEELHPRAHVSTPSSTMRGFIVLAPDFRASSGYGRDWRTAIYRKMGYPELEDFKDTIDWAVENHNGDIDRVGIYGRQLRRVHDAHGHVPRARDLQGRCRAAECDRLASLQPRLHQQHPQHPGHRPRGLRHLLTHQPRRGFWRATCSCSTGCSTTMS